MRKMTPFGDVLAAYPKLPRALLMHWCRVRTALGRPVGSEPANLPIADRRVDGDDVAGLVARFRDDLPARFIDRDGTGWVAEDVLTRRHGRTWKPTTGEAAAALGGRTTVQRAEFRVWGTSHHRTYAVRADVAAVMRRWAKGMPAGFVDIAAAEAMGFDGKFLAQYSDSAGRKRRAAFVAYPSLGHPIRTVRVRIRGRRGRPWRVGCSLDDLNQILNAEPPDTAVWLRLKPAMRHYRLTPSQITVAVRAGRVARERFPVRRAGLPRPQLRAFYDRQDLATEAVRLRASAAHRAKRPLGVDAAGRYHPFVRERGYVEGGKLYWPSINATRLAGVTSLYLLNFRTGCRYLPGGRAINFVVRPASWESLDLATGKPKEVFLYADDDLAAIWKERGHKGRRRSTPTGKPRGRERQHDADADAAFVARWKASGKTLAEFAAAEPVPLTPDEAEATHRRHRSNVANARRRERVK